MCFYRGLGWTDELEALFLEVGGKVHADEAARLKEARLNMSNDEILEAEIEKITEEVDKTLQISRTHTQKLKDELAKDGDKQGVSSTPSVPSSSSESSKENVPVNTEKVAKEEPASAPTVNTSAILDVTLPQNKPQGV